MAYRSRFRRRPMRMRGRRRGYVGRRRRMPMSRRRGVRRIGYRM